MVICLEGSRSKVEEQKAAPLGERTKDDRLKILGMVNCRSISTEGWREARERLIFYFSRKNGMYTAEDLAQETLMTLWSRSDFLFEREEDFLKVCYGFARKVHWARLRVEERYVGSDLDPEMEATIHPVKGLQGTEVSVFLQEVKHRANVHLLEEEMQLLRAALNRDVKDQPPKGKARTRLYRARRKLAELTGWSEVKKGRRDPSAPSKERVRQREAAGGRGVVEGWRALPR